MKRYIIGGIVFLFVICAVIDCTGDGIDNWKNRREARKVERMMKKGQIDEARTYCMQNDEMYKYFCAVLNNLEQIYTENGYDAVHMALTYIPYPDPANYTLSDEAKRLWGEKHLLQHNLAERNNTAIESFAKYLLYHDGATYIPDLLTFLQPIGSDESCNESANRIRDYFANLPAEQQPIDESVLAPQPVASGKYNLHDHLMTKAETFPIYAQEGDSLCIHVRMPQSGSVRLYNADSHQRLRVFQSKTEITETLPIANSAIYLLEVEPKGTQYADVSVQLILSNANRIDRSEGIRIDTVSCSKGDFRAVAVKGITMRNLFEEPRKLTLRGQLKASFSGASRAIVAIQVPNGATDVLYSLRIDTNERGRSSDGKFYPNMESAYHRVKFMGLPIYESQRGSGLIETLLGMNIPPRDEDAYINMYVFYDAAQARKFQDGTPANQVKYNLDYSTLGTQSCNGRIPSRGNKTIYLAFENERMRYNNYVWLEAISTIPATEYCKEVYSIK